MKFISLSYSDINLLRRYHDEIKSEICAADRIDPVQLYHSYSWVDESHPASHHSSHTIPITVDFFLYRWQQEEIQGI